MTAFFGVAGIAAIIVGLVMLAAAAIRKRAKRNALATLVAGLVVFNVCLGAESADLAAQRERVIA